MTGLPSESNADEVMCLAQNLYFEARNQPIQGKIAIGLVTFNRVVSPFFPSTICAVVYQKGQFSWYWDGKSDRPKNKKVWEQTKALAYALYNNRGHIHDFTEGSLWYHATYVAPAFHKSRTKVTRIGDHVFYR